MSSHRRVAPGRLIVADPGIVNFDFCIPKPGAGSLECGNAAGRGCVGMPLPLVGTADTAFPEELAVKRDRGRRDFGALIPAVEDGGILACEVEDNLLDKEPGTLGPEMGLCTRALTPAKVETAGSATPVSIAQAGSVPFVLRPSTPVSLLFMLAFVPSSILLLTTGAG